MACFLVPMALAIVTTIIQKKSKEVAEKLKFTILNALLWGGVTILAIEHIWHGEVTLTPPFLTAFATTSDISVVLREIAMVGTPMTLSALAVWGSILVLSYHKAKVLTLKSREHLENVM